MTDIDTLKRQLTQLRELHESGALSLASYEEGKVALERRIVDAVLQSPSPVQAPQPLSSAPAISASPQTGAAESETKQAVMVGVPKNFQLGLAAVVLAVAGLGYWWSGAPQFWNVGPSNASVAGVAGPTASASSAHSTEAEQIAAMVERLAQRMKEQPQDAEGWAMLARSYTVLERHADALPAYEKAVALRADDAQLLADYADSLAVKNGRNLAGEPMKWVMKALQLEPRNLKALALAGTEAFIRKDYKTALKYWEQVEKFAPPDSNYAKQVKPGIEEARQLGGVSAPPSAAKTESAPATVAQAKAPTAGAATVSGKVSLSANLVSQAGPNDTVFVFARPANGERMPLAVLRKSVKDLPFDFVLDDSLAMSPAAKLSDAKSVIISARVSKTGEALPSSGDLSGQVGPVEVGAKDLKLEIREAIK